MRIVPGRAGRALGALAGVALAAAPGPARGTDPAAHESWSVRQWTVNEGLPQSSVTALAPAEGGDLWVGTFGGLARFDGSRFVPVRVDGPGGLGSSRILALALGPDETLWVGAEAGGIGRLEGGRVVSLKDPGPLAARDVSSILVDRQGRVFALSGHELFRADGAAPRKVPLPGDPQRALTCLAAGEEGEVLVGSENGSIYRVRDDSVHEERLPWKEPRPGVISIALDGRGRIYIGASGSDAGLLDAGTFRSWSSGGGMPTLNRVAVVGRDGTVWMAPSHLGLARLREDGLEPAAVPSSRTGMIRSLLEDVDGGLWAGTESEGLFRIRVSAISSWGRTEGMPDGPVHPVAVDASGDLWAGVACSGLVRIRDGKVEIPERIASLRGSTLNGRSCVWSLLPARDGSLWIGTFAGELFRLFAGRLETKAGPERKSIVALFEDSEGAVWVGTRWAGLQRRAGDDVRTFGSADGLPGLDVLCVAQGADGRIWTAGSGGVAVLEGGRFRAIGPGEGLSSSQARVVVPESDGTTWVGTYGGGLNVLVDGRVGSVDFGKGLYENVVSWIQPRPDGWVWFTGNRGVYRARRESLLAAAFGPPGKKVQVFRWGAEDGLPSSETNGGFQPAGWVTPDGRFHVPTIAGVASFHPDLLTAGGRPVPVRIEEVTADGTPLPQAAGRVRVPARTRRLVVRYAAAALRPVERTFFRTKVQGLDPDWVEAGTGREIYLSFPRPGRTVVQVIACDETGRWSEDAASVVLEVAPAFHETPAFRLLALLAIVAAVVAVAGGRQAALSRRARELERLVDLRTAELNAANERLAEQALIDELTGLENVRALRRRLDEEIHRAVRRKRPMSFLMADVDYFKRFNDGLGHLAGDECLKRVGVTFRDALRYPSDLACRYGGEEFAVLLPETGASDALLVAERLRRHVESLAIPHPSSPVGPVVTVSVGVATRPAEGDAGPNELIAAADAALYRAKEAGRNRVVVAPRPETEG